MALGIEGLAVGVTTDLDNATGCTVILPPAGSVGGMAVRGGAPGTREAAVLSANSPSSAIHAVALCGSSLFGLRAASGVADWCSENGIGLRLPGGHFPIVGGAVVMDIQEPNQRRIDSADGRLACEAATTNDPTIGAVGAGTGCTIGKEAGRHWLSPGGQGWAVTSAGGVTVGALMIVNAFGSIYSAGQFLAGATAPASYPRYPAASMAELYDEAGEPVGEPEWGAMGGPAGPASNNGPTSNTVIGVVVTDSPLNKAEVCRMADLSHTGIARAVSPAHTSLDGDAMFGISTQTGQTAALDLLADLAASAVEKAIHRAVSKQSS